MGTVFLREFSRHRDPRAVKLTKLSFTQSWNTKMKFRIRTFIAVCCVAVSAIAFADSPKPNQSSSEIRVANEIDKYQAGIRAIDRQFAQSFSELRDAYTKQRKSLRGKVAKKLSAEQKKLTLDGDLDRAVKVRDQVQSIKDAEITMPNFSGKNGDVIKTSAPANSIEGTWRWNNGADITNYEGGETSGRGTWKLVDAKRQTYQFNWSKIAPDRVRLSSNGRVLEGTKAADPTFKVWAVRID